MASEVIKLNLIPKGEMPVFHASQFDTGRLITCELYRGEDAYSVPAGYTVELHCRKVDNNIVTMASTLINDNVVTFTSTEQLTACNGKNLCEVAILDDGYRIGTLNFILEVEIDPLKGGITSTSEIHNLESQIEDITTEIIGENYYDKSEVDDLLSGKADTDSVYTIGEVNSLLSGKANAADVYTKSQVDSALALKANAADVYTKTQTDAALATKSDKSDTYTKEQVDDIIFGIMPVDTASGATAEFNTQIAAPLVSVIADITASGGGGTPVSPVPIVGDSQAVITANGDNVTITFGQTVYGGVLDVTRGKLHVTFKKVHLTSSLSYMYGGSAGNIWYSNNDAYKPTTTSESGLVISSHFKAVTQSAMGSNDNCLCKTQNNAVVWIKDTTEGWADVATFKTWLDTQDANNNPVEIAFKLATPFDIDLTPEVISAVAGANAVSSDIGNIEVKYKTTIQDYLDHHTGG